MMFFFFFPFKFLPFSVQNPIPFSRIVHWACLPLHHECLDIFMSDTMFVGVEAPWRGLWCQNSPPHSLPQYAALTGDQCFVFLPPVTWRFITVFPQVVGFIFLEDGGICWRHCCVTTYCGALTGLSKPKFMDMLLSHSGHLSRLKKNE